jgi:hypothetical protein
MTTVLCFGTGESWTVFASNDSNHYRIVFSAQEGIKWSWMDLRVTDSTCIETISIDGIIRIDAKDITSVMQAQYNSNARARYINGVFCVVPENNDNVAIVVLFPSAFYKATPIGFQLFLRLSFLATLLALFALFWRKAIKNS